MNLNFDSTSIVSEEVHSDLGALEDGDYLCHIVESDEKISNAGNKYLNLKLQVLEGEYKNRYLWDIINLWHPKDNVRDIANQTMAAICRATGVLKPQTSEELHFKPLKVSVLLEIDSQYGEQNRVKRYKTLNAPSPPQKEVKPEVINIPKPEGEPVKDDIPF